MAGRHRFENQTAWEWMRRELGRGIYWGSRTTQATLATVVAVLAMVLISAFTTAQQAALPAPVPTVAQQTLPAAVSAWQARAAAATLATARTAAEADSEPNTKAERKAAKASCNDEG